MGSSGSGRDYVFIDKLKDLLIMHVDITHEVTNLLITHVLVSIAKTKTMNL